MVLRNVQTRRENMQRVRFCCGNFHRDSDFRGTVGERDVSFPGFAADQLEVFRDFDDLRVGTGRRHAGKVGGNDGKREFLVHGQSFRFGFRFLLFRFGENAQFYEFFRRGDRERGARVELLRAGGVRNGQIPLARRAGFQPRAAVGQGVGGSHFPRKFRGTGQIVRFFVGGLPDHAVIDEAGGLEFPLVRKFHRDLGEFGGFRDGQAQNGFFGFRVARGFVARLQLGFSGRFRFEEAFIEVNRRGGGDLPLGGLG